MPFLFAYIAAGLQTIFVTVFSYVASHVFEWLKQFFKLFMFDMIFRAFLVTGWLDPLRLFIQYLLNFAMFSWVPELAVVWLINIMLFWLSLEVLWIIFGHGNSTFNESDIGGDPDYIRETEGGYHVPIFPNRRGVLGMNKYPKKKKVRIGSNSNAV